MPKTRRPPRSDEKQCSRCHNPRPQGEFVGKRGQSVKVCQRCRDSWERWREAQPVATARRGPLLEEILAAGDGLPSPLPPSPSSAGPPVAQAPPPVIEPVENPAERALRESAARRRERELREQHAALVERLAEANARADVLEQLRQPYTPVVRPRETTSGLREGALVVLASDWHVEETVESEKVSGVNAYNLDIAEARIRRFFDGIRWLVGHHRQAFTMRDLVLWFGGDLITGYIHRELLETNGLSPVQAVMWLRQRLSDGIASLLADAHLERLVCPWSNGNHDRTTEKRQVKTGAENSFGWLLGSVLAEEWKRDPRVDFVVDRSAHQYAEVYGHLLHFTHGDELKYGGGVGGIGIPLLKRVPMWDRVRPAALHHIGHFHQFRDYGRAVVNGSLIGTTEYSVSIGADLEPPQQASYVLDAKRGKVMVTPIWVGESESTARAA